MAFIESPRFPDDLSYDFHAGPTWRTEVVTVHSGMEYRDQKWSQPMHAYDASYAVRFPLKFEAFKAFFHLARGRANAFRVKDWTDYKCPDHNGTGVFVMLTSTTFQMYKRYTLGSTFDRIIQKPVSGTVTVTGGTSPTVDYTTGIVTVSGGTPTAWSGEFDVPCRFGTDRLEATIETKSPQKGFFISVPSIPIVEIRP